MKIKYLLFALLVIPAVLLTACSSSTTNQQALSGSGIFGDHQVGKMTPETNIQGSLSGSFFFLSGGISGSINSETYLSFSWSPLENRYATSCIPKNKFLTIIDETKTSPIVVFSFNERWLNWRTPYPNANGYTGGPYPQSAISNVNAYVESDNLVQVLVYISSADLLNEPNLPHP